MLMIATCRYDPGSICMFFSSQIYHKVENFQPAQQTAEEKRERLTPGRIGTVMFFPKASYEILEGKPPGWAVMTNSGRHE